MTDYPADGFRMSVRRAMLIAKRDFLGYVKTWGFWLSSLGPFIGIFFGLLMPFVMAKSEPTHIVSILDETGLHGAAIEQLLVEDNREIMELALRSVAQYTVPREEKPAFEAILDNEGPQAAKAFITRTNPRIAQYIEVPDSKLNFIVPPVDNIEGLKPYVLGDETIRVDGEEQTLAGVLHIYVLNGVTHANYWSTMPLQNALADLADRHFSRTASANYLQSGGLNREAYLETRSNAVSVTAFNPEKEKQGVDGQAVTAKDRIPYFIAAGLSVILWFAVFTGAYMLLMSMVEEKINKVLEMLLASTRFSEIFFGKLIGVAALTIATLLPWIIMGGVGFYFALTFGDGAVAEGLSQAMSIKMLVFLPIFFLLGYIFYGSMFIALGAMAESMQDASTLMTPMVLLLTACILVVPIGVTFPDSPLLIAAQYFPFSAPFAAIIRLPSDPPLWETLLSVFILILSSGFVVWLSGRLFKHGVLTGGGMANVKAWFARKLRFKRG